MAEMYDEANLYTLVDEEGVEQTFEMLDTMEVDGKQYYAMIPVYDTPEEQLENDGELIVLTSEEVDGEEYLAKLTAACVAEPDLNDAALQRSWGVMGAEALLKRMLAAGEFARLAERAQAVCGFDEPVRELADEIKKESCRATQN